MEASLPMGNCQHCVCLRRSSAKIIDGFQFTGPQIGRNGTKQNGQLQVFHSERFD